MLPRNTSLFAGGLLPKVLLRLGIRDKVLNRIRGLSILIVPLVAWLPLLVLTAAGGTLQNRNVSSPFLTDFGTHIRLLVVLPLLLIAGRVAEYRIRPTIAQFTTHYLIPDSMMARFQRVIDSAYGLGDSVVADFLIIAMIYLGVSTVERQVYLSTDASTWYSPVHASTLTLAGMWFVYVSLPMFQFVLLRWYFRLFIWARFLAQVAGLKLRLIPSHPDRVGGLGFLILAMQSLSIFAMAHGALLAGWLANRILVRGERLPDFKGEIVLVVIFVLCITIAPLFAFTRSLVLAKRRGILEYGTLASHYVNDFDSKWIRKERPQEELVGSADVQSLADMGGSYELVENMRVLPFTPQMIVVFILATLLPVLPLALTEMPLSELLKKLVGILF